MTSSVDWSVLEIPGVMEVAESAARRASVEYELMYEFEDAQQEAYLILAAMPDRVRQCVGGEGRLTLGTLAHEVYRDLIDKVKRPAAHKAQVISIQRLAEAEEAAA
ncbi:hypothetical protein [Kineococcus esterisolvens]|uniref:hypothetical protein n=1 Tax=unclassified Kineococcus TaxID=2621656 RepID=UPI003D7C519D